MMDGDADSECLFCMISQHFSARDYAWNCYLLLFMDLFLFYKSFLMFLKGLNSLYNVFLKQTNKKRRCKT